MGTELAPGTDEMMRGVEIEGATDYGQLVWSGKRLPLPTLHLDDLSAIPFLVGIPSVEEYQHRARLRAGDGDLFAAVTADSPGYEDYCRDHLDIGAPELLIADPVDGLLEVARACAEGEAFERLVARARAAGGLVIHPYMGHQDVWRLAHLIGRESGTPCVVIGPPPAAMWIANDKAQFTEVVAEAVGRSWVIPTRLGNTIPDIAANLLELGKDYARVGLKRTRTASSMGNAIFDTADLVAGDCESAVRAFLERTQWPAGEQVLAVAWLNTDVSPSTQLWIPPAGTGVPRLDGIYEQILEGATKVFLGSRPSTLPDTINARLADAALAVAAALQQRGYYGRCSFDHLVVGDPGDDPQLLFTECNGRWGGTSTPMSLLDRLLGGAPRPPYRAQDVVHQGLVGVPFREILTTLGDEVFDPKTGRGRYVFYNVGCLARSGKLDVIAMGETHALAETAMLEDLPRRLGL